MNLETLAAIERLKSIQSYRSKLRSTVRALWTGEWTWETAYNRFRADIEREFTNAWYEGLKAAGLTPDDMNDDERLQLLQMIIQESNYIAAFLDAIEENSRENGGALEPLMTRVDLWVKRYTNVKNQALATAKNDPVLEWVLHANESCPSCLKMAGQRRRASVFARLDIRPQHPRKLECMVSAGGVDVCQCTLVPTEQSPSRGRLPKLP